MKFTFTMHFIFGTEMEQFVELVQNDEIYKTKITKKIKPQIKKKRLEKSQAAPWTFLIGPLEI